MEDAKLFEDACLSKSIGSRIIIDEQPFEIANCYRTYIQCARGACKSASQAIPRLLHMHPDLVANDLFGACAFKEAGRYFIAFNSGLFYIMGRVVNRIMADQRLFTHVGNPLNESEHLPLIQRLTQNAAIFEESNLAPIVPRCIQRQRYAEHLCNLIFNFLVTHEITHIAHGHVDYLKMECGIPVMSEVQWSDGNSGGQLERQMMELDADSTAARMIAHTSNMSLMANDILSPEVVDFFKSPHEALFDIAISILFRLFGDPRMKGIDLSNKKHPPYRWRQMHILNMTGNVVEKTWENISVHQIEERITSAIEEVERGFELITGQEQQVLGLHDAWNEQEAWTYLDSLQKCWNEGLRLKLTKYSFEELGNYNFELREI